jgi:hypothetical protein
MTDFITIDTESLALATGGTARPIPPPDPSTGPTRPDPGPNPGPSLPSPLGGSHPPIESGPIGQWLPQTS